MQGGGDHRQWMHIDTDPLIPTNPRPLASPSVLNHASPRSPFSREGVQVGGSSMRPEFIVDHSKKLQDEVQELGQKIKHHEESVKYLKSQNKKLEDSIFDLQIALGKCVATSCSKREDEETANVDSEQEIFQRILKYEGSAAALLCRLKSLPEAEASDHPFTKDVLGVVATLGKVDDDNLSRLLSEYLGLETMLAVVCKTYEGVKALEAYTGGLINENLGLHSFAASTGIPLDGRFEVICLEKLRPYTGGFILNDPQRRFDLVKPTLPSGETPTGFLGFAVNMISIEYKDLYCMRTGYSLRETLFYHLFSTLQVYRSREDMLKALPFIPRGAISLDGGIIRSPNGAVLSLGHQRRNIDIKFPGGCKSLSLPENHYEIENRLKETKWTKDQTLENMHREQALLDRAKFNFEAKKREFLQFLADSSSYAVQAQVATPR